MIIGTGAPIDRVFFSFGPFTIYWYGIIIVVGILLAAYIAGREANRIGLEQDSIIDFLVYAVPIAIVFARIYYVTFEFESYISGPLWKAFAIWEGGIAIHGAVIGGVITAIIYTRIRTISFWQFADVLAPSLILGEAIGRWGNFTNQEAHGGPISEAQYEGFYQYLPDFIMNQMVIDGVMYHPMFLYQSTWNMLIFVSLLLFRKMNPRRGMVFLFYVVGYSIGRFFIEALRTDSLYIIGDLRTAQFVSILAIVTGLLMMIYRMRRTSAHYMDERVNDRPINR